MAIKKFPRGVRYNNPTNIRNSSTKWDGETGKDEGGFESFISSFFGLRAGARLLKSYNTKYGINTVAGISQRWAPITENNTAEHAATISKVSGFPLTAKLNMQDPSTVALLLKGIVRAENGTKAGFEWYTDNELKQATAAAFKV